MSKYVGDFLLGQTPRRVWTTRGVDGSRIDLSDALEAGDVVVLKDGNPTALTTPGLTVAQSIGSRVGVHSIAADTTQTEYTAGSDYTVLVYPNTETVDGKSVAAVLMEFSIENRPPNIATVPARSVGARPLLGVIDSGVAQSVSGTVIRLRAATEFTNDDVNAGAMIMLRGSSGGFQCRALTDFDGTTKDATVDATVFTPGGTVFYQIIAAAPVSPSQKFPATLAAGDIATDALSAAAASAAFVTKIQNGLATASTLATVAGYLDTEIAAILTAVDTEVAAIKAKTDNLPSSPAAVGSEMALTSGIITTLVNAIVRAANGADGYGIEKDVPNNRIILTIPGVGTVDIPANFSSASPGVDAVG